MAWIYRPTRDHRDAADGDHVWSGLGGDRIGVAGDASTSSDLGTVPEPGDVPALDVSGDLFWRHRNGMDDGGVLRAVGVCILAAWAVVAGAKGDAWRSAATRIRDSARGLQDPIFAPTRRPAGGAIGSRAGRKTRENRSAAGGTR